MIIKIIISLTLSFNLYAINLIDQYNNKKKVFVFPRGKNNEVSYSKFLKNTGALKVIENHCKKCKLDKKDKELAKLYYKTYLKTHDLKKINKSVDHHTEFDKKTLESFIVNTWSNAKKVQYGSNYFLSEDIGEWIYDSGHEKSRKLNLNGEQLYDAFWDVSPIVLMGSLFNYLKIRNTPLIADMNPGLDERFASILGYYFLPVRSADIKKSFSYVGSKVYPVHFRLKLIFMTNEFKIFPSDWEYLPDNSTSDREKKLKEGLFERFLEFVVYFENPVDLTENASKLRGGGRIKGQGIWNHREDKKTFKNLNFSHPDFVFFPSISADVRGVHPLVSDILIDDSLSNNDVHAFIHKNVTTTIKFSKNSKAFEFLQKIESLKHFLLFLKIFSIEVELLFLFMRKRFNLIINLLKLKLPFMECMTKKKTI